MRVLRLGMTGDDVRRWQTFLLGRDVAVELITHGTFDPVTKAATEAYQFKNSLDVTGALDNRTLAVAIYDGYGIMVDLPDIESGTGWPPPSRLLPLTMQERKDAFGTFAYASNPIFGSPEGIKIVDRDWESVNIVPVVLPVLAKDVRGLPQDRMVLMHRRCADRLVGLVEAWRAAGVLHHLTSWGGSWMQRFVRGSRSEVSAHAWGIAIDVNVRWNPVGSMPRLLGEVGSVRALVKIANELGWWWGGHAERPEGAHFELARM